MFVPVVFATVVPDEDGQRSADDEGQVPVPSRSQTPPTPPVQAASPPACSRPSRQRAMAQLRPVSIPEIVRDMAGSDPLQKIADLDRHYMPEGQPAAEVSSRGTSDAHRAFALKAWIFRYYPQTEVTLMCTEHFLMIRYKTKCHTQWFITSFQMLRLFCLL